MAATPPDMQANRTAAPFSVDALRAAWVAGSQWTVRIVGPAQTYLTKTYTVTKAEDTGVHLKVENFGPNGRRNGGVATRFVSWEEFRRQATHPAERTQIRTERIRTRLGSFTAKAYYVTDRVRTDHTEVFYFTDAQPGIPVKVDLHLGKKVVTLREIISVR